MTMVSSVLTTGQLLQEDLGLRSTVNNVSIEKAIHKVVPDQESAASLSTQFLTIEPSYRSEPTRLLVPRAGSYEVLDIQVKPIEDCMVLRLSSIKSSESFGNTVLEKELESWFQSLTRYEKKSDKEVKNFLSHQLTFFNNELNKPSFLSQVKELHDLIGFDQLKSYLFLSEFVVGSLSNALDFYKRSLHLEVVKANPYMSLLFFSKINGLVMWPGDESEKESLYLALLKLIQLPHFSFALFEALFDNYYMCRVSDSIKCVNNLVGLIENGHLSFQKLEADYQADRSRVFPTPDLTDSFCRALMKGYISLDLQSQEDYEDCYPALFLKETSDRDKDLNCAFEGLYERLAQNPAFTENPTRWHALVNHYLGLFQIPEVDAETGMMVFRDENEFFSQFYKKGEITGEKLYQEIIKLEAGLRKVYNDFVATNAIISKTSDLRKLFNEGSEVFSFYEYMYICFGLDIVESEETRNGISSLSQLTDMVLSVQPKKITEFFSTELLEIFISLKPEEIRHAISQIKQIDRADGREPGLIQVFSHVLRLRVKRLSAGDIQHFIFFALLRMKELRALMREEGVPIQETHLLVSIEFVFSLLNEELAREMLKNVFDLDQQILRGHIQFLRESTLRILHDMMGSKAASKYFEKMVDAVDFPFIKALFLFSLKKLTQEDWVHYLTYFLKDGLYEGQNDETYGLMDTEEGLNSFGDFMQLALKQSLAGNELDLDAIAAKVRMLGYDSSNESDEDADELSFEFSESESESE